MTIFTRALVSSTNRTASCASMGGIHENAKDCANWLRDSFHLVVGGCASVRVRRLRSEPASQQCVGPMHMGRSKSSLVPETYGPHGRSHARWNDGLLQVIAFGSARRTNSARRPRGYAPSRGMSLVGQSGPSKLPPALSAVKADIRKITCAKAERPPRAGRVKSQGLRLSGASFAWLKRGSRRGWWRR